MTTKQKTPAARTKVKASVPRYFKSLDLMLASIEYARKGMPNRAAKALSQAAQDPEVDQAIQQLSDQQQQLQDQDFQMQQQQNQDQGTQQMSRALARLIKASQQQQTEGDDQDEDGDEQDADCETSGSEMSGEDDFDSEDDLDIAMDDDDLDGEGVEEQVQASVKARLEKASRNRAARA